MTPVRFEIMPSPDAAPSVDERIPPRDRVVTRDIFERLMLESPNRNLLLFEDDESDWTVETFHEAVVQTAIGLQGLGVRQDERVVVMLPNGREAVRLFFAINYLGAIFVPVSITTRGTMLLHALAVAGATLAVVTAELVPHFATAEPLELIVVVGDTGTGTGTGSRHRTHRYEDVLLPSGGTLLPPERRIEPWDVQSLMFTSGTTGRSKGVLSSYLHLYTNAGPDSWPMVSTEDRFLVQYPLSHIGGTAILFSMFARGGSCVVIERFDTMSFWNTVRETGCTVVFLLGVMATFLLRLPVAADERNHSLRLALIVPVGDAVTTFGPRFGVDVYTIFNMTEVSTPLRSGINPPAPGTSGRPRPGVEARLVDANDAEVAFGAVGELIVRTDRPWAMNSGYAGDPVATASAWRNGWFHTGDLFRQGRDGEFFFVDRAKDAIRRRGENIASFEIEAEALAHPSVREAAAVGVPSVDGEEEVLLCVALADGTTTRPADLLEFLGPRMARHMLPRYLRVLAALPKTPSAKVMKGALRDEGLTADTWDRLKV
jgi:crotonobetaine/carnitine-CoA ligase